MAWAYVLTIHISFYRLQHPIKLKKKPFLQKVTRHIKNENNVKILINSKFNFHSANYNVVWKEDKRTEKS